MKNKKRDFDKLFSHIKSGMFLATGIAAGEPQKLLEEFKKRIKKWHGLRMYTQIPRNSHLVVEPGLNRHLFYNLGFISKELRDLVNRGEGTFMPSHNSLVPVNFINRVWPVDAVLIQTTPPDKHGNVSLGVSVDYIKPALTKAKIILAQINQHMPYTYGDSLIPLNRITAFIEHDEPLLELPFPKGGTVEKKIGKYIASLVPDGATLQLGNGAIPDAVLSELSNKKDLGIHSEMFSDNLIPLVEKGVITGARKNIDRGKIIAGFIMGTKKVYDFVHKNRKVLLKSWLYTNNIGKIAKNDRMISINSALEVDFTGQVSAESIGPYEFSGTGGQVDFVRGAQMSKEGKSIIAFKSTAKNDTVSRIVPYLSNGAIVTTTRHDVDYIVTEYGIAHLRGKSLSERARLLINISHPKFRKKYKKIIESTKNKWKTVL